MDIEMFTPKECGNCGWDVLTEGVVIKFGLLKDPLYLCEECTAELAVDLKEFVPRKGR